MSQFSIAEVRDYILVRLAELPAPPLKPDLIASLKREVISVSQGEMVELLASMSPLNAVLAFSAIYDVADEVVLRLEDNQLILLFDHHLKEVLRPDKVNRVLWEEVLRIKNKVTVVHDVLAPKTETTINLVSLWNKSCKNEDLIVCSKFFIKTLIKELRPSITITLTGEIPILPLLLAVYLSRSYGLKIFFVDNQGVTVNLFSNF